MVDISGGPQATSYPVTYLDNVPEEGWTDDYKTGKIVLRRIAPGSFVMGSPTNELGREYWSPNETPHEVTLTKDFHIGVFGVTQRQYELVTGNRVGFFTNDSCYAIRPVEGALQLQGRFEWFK